MDEIYLIIEGSTNARGTVNEITREAYTNKEWAEMRLALLKLREEKNDRVYSLKAYPANPRKPFEFGVDFALGKMEWSAKAIATWDGDTRPCLEHQFVPDENTYYWFPVVAMTPEDAIRICRDYLSNLIANTE